MVVDDRPDGRGFGMGFAVGVAMGIVHRHVTRADVGTLPSGPYTRLVAVCAWTPVVVAVDRTLDGVAARLAFLAGVGCGSAVREALE